MVCSEGNLELLLDIPILLQTRTWLWSGRKRLCMITCSTPRRYSTLFVCLESYTFSNYAAQWKVVTLDWFFFHCSIKLIHLNFVWFLKCAVYSGDKDGVSWSQEASGTCRPYCVLETSHFTIIYKILIPIVICFVFLKFRILNFQTFSPAPSTMVWSGK